MPVIITPNCNIPEIDLYNAGYIVNLTKKSLFQCFDKISNLSKSQYRKMCINAFKLCSDHFVLNIWRKNMADIMRIYHLKKGFVREGKIDHIFAGLSIVVPHLNSCDNLKNWLNLYKFKLIKAGN